MAKPFKFLFKKLTPAAFARFFAKEAPQTRAFLLAFAPNPQYVEEALAAFDDPDFTGLVSAYLSRDDKGSAGLSFIRGLEKHIREIMRESLNVI